MAILTDELILTKSSAKSVAEVRNLNLWGCELDDIGVLKNCSSLEILSLSVNNLKSLEQLSECKNLKELYLRKNYIDDAEQVKHLTTLRNLEILWLCDNPCADDEKKYRNIVLRFLPWLKKLDHHDVTDDEVLASMSSLPGTMPPKIHKRLTSNNNSSSSEVLNGIESLRKTDPKIHDNDHKSTSSDNIATNSFKSSSWSQPKANYDIDDSSSIYKSPKPIRANSNGILYSHGTGQSNPRARSPAINTNRPPSRTPPPPPSQGGIKLTKSKSNNGSVKTNVNGNIQPKLSGKSMSTPLSKTPPPRLNNIAEAVTPSTKDDSRQSNVLIAVLALIDELEEKDLHAVQRKLQLTMLNRQGKPGKK